MTVATDENRKVICGRPTRTVPGQIQPPPGEPCDSRVRLGSLYGHLTHPFGPHQLEPEQARRAVEEAYRRAEHEHRAAVAMRNEAMKQARHDHLSAQGPKRARGWTLDTYPAADVEGRRALRAARQWIEGEGWLRHPRLYIWGPNGSGKTGLAYSIARKWISDDDVRRAEFENVTALLERQRVRFARGESTALGHLTRATPHTLIVLDDLGNERHTEWAVDTIALIVDHLHADDVLLIVTSNYAPSELAERLGRHNPIAGARIVSRLREDALVIHLDRPDLRMQPAGEADQTAHGNEVARLGRDDDEGGESPPRRHQGGERRRKGHTA